MKQPRMRKMKTPGDQSTEEKEDDSKTVHGVYASISGAQRSASTRTFRN